MADPRDPARPSRAPRLLREQLGWTVLVLGAGLCFLGWYGVSGERHPAQQIPYLASATAPGVALLLGGCVLVAAARQRAERPERAEPGRESERESEREQEPSRGRERQLMQERMARQLDALYWLLTEESTPVAAARTAAEVGLFAVPGGRTYHRVDCLLLQGRHDTEPVPPVPTGTQLSLQPCPLCDPPDLAEGG